MFDRRKFLLAGAALSLSGCRIFDSASDSDSALRQLFASHEGLTRSAQRALIGDRLAVPDLAPEDLSPGEGGVVMVRFMLLGEDALELLLLLELELSELRGLKEE